MQRRSVNLMALVALGTLGAAPALAHKDKSTDDGEMSFATPEGVIQHLAATLRAGDLASALAAFGIPRRVRDYSFVKMAERLRAIALSHNAPPVRFELYADIATAQFTHEAATQLRNLVYSMLAPAGTSLDKLINFDDGPEAGQFAGDLEIALDPARLANLTVLRTAIPNAERAASEQFQRVIAGQLVVTGGDDLQERVVLYDLDGQTYRSGLTLARYGDRWLVRTLVANLGGTSPAGYAEPMSEAEFLEAVS